MADTENKVEALENEVVAENVSADAPKKNAVAAEPSHIAKMNNAEDLGAAVVKPTDSNPDATKKVKEVSGDPQQKNEGGADPMEKLSGHNTKLESKETEDEKKEEVNEGELPAGLKKYLDKKDDKEKKEGYGKMKKEEDEKEKEMKKEEKDLDVSEHVNALIAGETDLSEEFKSKAATVFEAAIKSKVKDISEEMEADFKQKFEEETSKAKDELVEKVDSYLSYVVEEWMKENQIALERGIKGEIAEDFISGLKKLFEDHYIDVPDEKYNVLEEQASKIDELEKKLNESIEKSVELKKSVAEFTRQSVINEMSKDLADTAKEKFNKLAEEIEYSNEEDFRAKVGVIKESYFGKKVSSNSEIDDVAADSNPLTEDLSNAMAAYSAAISKTKDIKLSK